MGETFQKELKTLGGELRDCLQQTKPTHEFRDTIALAMFGTHFTASRIEKTDDPGKRRLLIREFNKSISAIKNGIQLLKHCRKRTARDHTTEAMGKLP
ncbi:MAG: hypothetical protein SWH78_16860 [Thermodesulfobacteriota bacterium]|nr:hypothetical protein [Thermodesulfobacteriota bacterium]